MCSGRGVWTSLALADYWSHLALVFLKVLVAGTLSQSHARGGAPSPVLGEGRLEKSCLGSHYWSHLALPGLLHLL